MEKRASKKMVPLQSEIFLAGRNGTIEEPKGLPNERSALAIS
jgi:hypothetical protein